MARKVTVFFLLTCMMCVMCAGALANDKALEKYAEPTTITVIRSISNRDYVEGESWDDNIWTRQIEQDLNIKFDYIWACDNSEFDAKLNLAVATGDLADLMNVPYDTFYRMAKNNMLCDLTEAYDTYASDNVRRNMSTYDGIALDMCSSDGKLYGLTAVPGYAEGVQLLWYRNDWAKRLGLEAPKNWDEVVNMFYAFAQKDPNGDGSKTVGTGLTTEIFGSGMNLNTAFAVYGAYPKQWIVGADGKMAYGGVQPEAKEALSVFAQWYKDGVLDADFINLGAWAEGPDSIVKGKVGAAIGETWFGDWQTGLLMKNVGWDATWTCMMVPGKDGAPVHSPVESKPNSVLCGAASSKNPEALVKIVNLSEKYGQSSEAEGRFHDVKDAAGNTVNTFFYMQDLIGNVGGNPDWNMLCSDNVCKAIESGDSSTLTDEEMSYYTRSMAYLNKEDPMGYASYSTFGPGGAKQICRQVSADQAYHANAYYGPSTNTMADKWSNIYSKQQEVYTRILMGGDIDSEWDGWVSFFNAQGGDKITEEVNAWNTDRQDNAA